MMPLLLPLTHRKQGRRKQRSQRWREGRVKSLLSQCFVGLLSPSSHHETLHRRCRHRQQQRQQALRPRQKKTPRQQKLSLLLMTTWSGPTEPPQ